VEQVSSRVVYRNAWMTVREDEVRRADGSPGLYGVVDKSDFALVVPRQDDGFWLVEQYRYPVGRRAWEFPQGTWGSGESGSAQELAVAELREETGLTATDLRHLGRLSLAYGLTGQGYDVFLATGLVPGPPAREASEQDMVSRWFSDADLVAMLRSGEIEDASTVAAYALLLLDGSLPPP
jgi:8-oxo-dGTP pyrophosphatase MutT (NUDIX family)